MRRTPCPHIIHKLMIFDSGRWKQLDKLRPHCANTYEQLGNKSAFSSESDVLFIIRVC